MRQTYRARWLVIGEHITAHEKWMYPWMAATYDSIEEFIGIPTLSGTFEKLSHFPSVVRSPKGTRSGIRWI
jgi:hypothetical protein